MGQNDTIDYVYTNNFYSSKNTIRRKKRQATKWEETFKYTCLTKMKKTCIQHVSRTLVSHDKQIYYYRNG